MQNKRMKRSIEMNKNKIINKLFILAIALFALVGCSTGDSSSTEETRKTSVEANEESLQDETLKVGIAALPAQLDPGLGIGIASIKVFYNIYDTLFYTTKDGEVEGRLAEDWDWIDDKTLEVSIREGVTFHNGDHLTADDVKFTFDRILSDFGNGTIAVLYETLDSVDKVDDLTVQFNLNRSDAAFEQRLGSIWGANIVPKDYVEEVGDEAFQTAPIGTGPYELVKYSPERYTLERYEDFWSELPAARSIELIEVPEASSRMTGLMTGELDIINDIPSDQVDTVSDAEGINVLSTPIKNIHVYTFQTKDENSIMSNLAFRQGLNHAIDRETLVDMLWYENAQVPNGHQFEAYGDLYIEDYQGVGYDPDLARELIEESGYDGEEVITIEMADGYYTNGNEAGQTIVSMWNDVGVKAEIQYTDEFSHLADVRAWSSASRFDNPLGALWLLFGTGSGPANEETGNWTPTDRFVEAGNTLIDSRENDEQRKAAGELLDEFDTFVPGTYLYQAEDIFGIRDGIEWDLHYAENQVLPFRAGDIQFIE